VAVDAIVVFDAVVSFIVLLAAQLTSSLVLWRKKSFEILL
jgi:hypothetical protein